MITTICLNPCFDKTVEIETLQMGEVNRIRKVRQDMGGKGINVATVAHRLGLDCECIGCMGEDGSAQLVAMLEREGLRHDFITVPGSVRTNMKIVADDQKGVTELNEPGTPLTEENLAAFFELARQKARGSSTVVLTGSLPPECPDSTYHDLMREMDGTACILDTTGQGLMMGAKARPFLMKPNLSELQATLGLELRTLRSIRDAALLFIKKGAKHMIVSMGAMGAMYVGDDRTLFAPALRVDARSTVGAGDAMIGGILKGLEVERDMASAFRYGVAAGAASVMTEGTQLIRLEDFEMLLKQVRVQEV